MKEMKEYTIPFVGLKVGQHKYDFNLDKKFFEHFEYDEFHQVDLSLEVVLDKKPNMLEIDLSFEGSVNVSCDRTNEPFDLALNGNYHYVVKFGQERDDMHDELVILPHGAYQVNIQQQVYESIVLALPSKRIHPGIAEGTLESDVLKQLEALKPNGTDQDQSDSVDPRWDGLKKLLTDK
jgi:uncharacterized metal-binding protein YceD (DUF177 family)